MGTAGPRVRRELGGCRRCAEPRGGAGPGPGERGPRRSVPPALSAPRGRAGRRGARGLRAPRVRLGLGAARSGPAPRAEEGRGREFPGAGMRRGPCPPEEPAGAAGTCRAVCRRVPPGWPGGRAGCSPGAEQQVGCGFAPGEGVNSQKLARVCWSHQTGAGLEREALALPAWAASLRSSFRRGWDFGI